MASAELPARVAALRARERRAVAGALNLAEDRRAEARAELAALLTALGDDGGFRVGVTGPPGAGKSSLLAALGREFRARGETVAVVAVDPTSSRTGGALLGDRVRMAFDPEDDGFFVRSLATAGLTGGLAPGAAEAAQLLSAGFDWTFLETTGVGQSETAVEHAVDLVVVVVQPGGGDLLQFIKAGVMEIPDLLVVGKADLGPVAERSAAELRHAVARLRGAGVEQSAPVLVVSAHGGQGLAALADALGRARDEAAGTLASRRSEGAVERALAELLRLHGEVGVRRLGGTRAARARLRERLAAGASVPQAVDEAAASL